MYRRCKINRYLNIEERRCLHKCENNTETVEKIISAFFPHLSFKVVFYFIFFICDNEYDIHPKFLEKLLDLKENFSVLQIRDNMFDAMSIKRESENTTPYTHSTPNKDIAWMRVVLRESQFLSGNRNLVSTAQALL